MKKILIVGAIDFGVSMTKLHVSCVDLKESTDTTIEKFDEFKIDAEYVKLKQEYKHPFDKFINGKKNRR